MKRVFPLQTILTFDTPTMHTSCVAWASLKLAREVTSKHKKWIGSVANNLAGKCCCTPDQSRVWLVSDMPSLDIVQPLWSIIQYQAGRGGGYSAALDDVVEDDIDGERV